MKWPLNTNPIVIVLASKLSVGVQYNVIISTNCSVAPIQQFAYMLICLYFIIQIAFMQILSCTCNYRHIQPWLHISSDCTCAVWQKCIYKAWKILCKLYRQCIGNAVAYIYRYSAYIFNIGTYSHPYSSIDANPTNYCNYSVMNNLYL